MIRFELHFRRTGGELQLAETKFWDAWTPPAASPKKGVKIPAPPVPTPKAHTKEKRIRPSATETFDWHASQNGLRGFSILFLRYFAEPSSGFTLHGPRGSLAASAVEVIRAEQRQQLNWAGRMFAHDQKIPCLPHGLF